MKYFRENMISPNEYEEIKEKDFEEEVIKFRNNYKETFKGSYKIYEDLDTGLKYKKYYERK